MKTPLISVILPVRNEGERVLQTLKSFVDGRSWKFPIEFVVVDDASGDHCCSGLEDKFGRNDETVQLRVVRLPRWSGIPYARNTGAYGARAPILFISDANATVSKCWDTHVLREIKPRRALCGVITDTRSSWAGYGCSLLLPTLGTRWLREAHASNSGVPVMPEAATIITTALFRSLGGYDTALPLYGACEPEFSMRLWLSGATIQLAPEIRMAHRFRPTAERRQFMAGIQVLVMANYLRFAMLYLDAASMDRTFRHYSVQAPAVFQNALRRLDRNEIDARRAHLEATLKFDFEWYVGRFCI